MVQILKELLRVKSWVNSLIYNISKYRTSVYDRIRDMKISSKIFYDWGLLDIMLGKGRLKGDSDLWE